MRWNFIHGLFELAIYGGRVDNPFDTSVMVSYLEQFFDQNVLSQGAKNKRLGPLKLPTSTNFRVNCFVLNETFMSVYVIVSEVTENREHS